MSVLKHGGSRGTCSSPRCVIVGPPGAGKTTIGELVADALGVAFRDTDADIEATAGKPIPDIFIDEGEAYFRKLEAAAVAEALATHDGVLALGGGAILDGHTRARLDGQFVVHLSVELADAVKRVGLGTGRPLLSMNPRATLRHLLDARRPLYLEVATVTVPTDDRDPADIAADVVAAVTAR